MKTLKNYLATGLLGASLLFGAPKKSNAQFEKIRVRYEPNVSIEVTGYKESYHSGSWAGISDKGTQIETWTHKNDSTARYEFIYPNSKIDKIYSEKHDLKTGKWSDKEWIDTYSEEEVPLEFQDRVSKIINMDKICNHDWKYFLQKEINRWTEKPEDISLYLLYYFDIDENKFPKSIEVKAYGSKNEKGNYPFLSKITYTDYGNDKKYNEIELKTTVNSEETRFERIRINKNTLDYFMNYLVDTFSERVDIRFGTKEDFTPEQQKRIKEILRLNIDCSENEAIPFLYDEFYRWSEDY